MKMVPEMDAVEKERSCSPGFLTCRLLRAGAAHALASYSVCLDEVMMRGLQR